MTWKIPPARLRRVLNSPARLTIAAFAGAIGVGAAALMLPAASRGAPLGFVDALFTATSATCVTGLVVVDTGSAFTWMGQGVILVLIQMGGLGIMSVSTLLILMAGRRLGLAGSVTIQDTFTHSGNRRPAAILRDVVLFTVFFEALGAGVLFLRFLPDHSPGSALYLAVFHAVSAFCNAGFSLFSDSFVRYRGDWVVNLTLTALIVAGGIGFLVISEVRTRLVRRPRRWLRLSLHTKIVLTATGALLAAGTLLLLFMEWNNTLAGLPVPDRLLAAFFQSATARTAGFNTLAVDRLANESLFLVVLLMFVGASPGSCGGGIKTTTLSTLLVLGWGRLRGRRTPQIFYREIPQASVVKATSVAMMSIAVVVLGTLILLMTELGEISHLESRGRFLELLFETVSAFGTVGLSMGATGGLSWPGRLVVTLVMLVGRLGPLVVGVAISRREGADFRYAEENIMVG